MTRRIAVVSSDRADYGLLAPVVDALTEEDQVELRLIVGGTHFKKSFGLTGLEILERHPSICYRINEDADGETVPEKAFVDFFTGVSVAIDEIKPDLMVLLGDRYEIVGSAIAATLKGIPIAHIHGGDLSEGSFDDAFRHSITMMASFHFPMEVESARRIIQMGEDPTRVFECGSLAAHVIAKQVLLSRHDVEVKLGFALRAKNMLVTFHPETRSTDLGMELCGELLQSLASFPDWGIVFTRPNADPGGSQISDLISTFCSEHSNAVFRESLGQELFLALASLVDCVVGNSSSGVLEVPHLNTPVINLGTRQLGRRSDPLIVDVRGGTESISEAIRSSTARRVIRSRSMALSGPVGASPAQKIARILASHPLTGIWKKKFFDSAV